MPSAAALETFRQRWPGKDAYAVINSFLDKWRAGGNGIRNPDRAFPKLAEGMFKARGGKGRAAA